MLSEEWINELLQLSKSEEGAKIAAQAVERYKKLPEGNRVLELKESEISKVLKVSYIAERFFGKSSSWLYHKLNHDIKNGKPDSLTEAERLKLKDALDTIAFEIQILSDNM